MDVEVRKELNSILNELPGENSWIEYKAKAYEKTELNGLINDICAFLNSEQSYGRNKYIICGIGNDKSRLGIKQNDMLDDHFFQDAIKSIYPMPKIITDTFVHEFEGNKRCYGYILICKENEDRVYEIYKDHIKNKDGNVYTAEQFYENNAFAPLAWIRVGSTKDKLTEIDRRRIYNFDKNKIISIKENQPMYLATDYPSSNSLKVALLIGKWDESNPNDKNIIERYSKETYDVFIEKIRRIAKSNSDLSFKNGKWNFRNRYNYIKSNALEFYREDFHLLNPLIIEVLSEKHPKLELSTNNRPMANLYLKNTKYSAEIREGLAEVITIINNLNSFFENCRIDASNFVILTIRGILEKSKWYTWASLDRLLLYLAEAHPREFINQLKKYLLSDKEMSIISEKEESLTSYSYVTSIYWSLELIAWNEDNFTQSCLILSEFAKMDKEAIKHIVAILLPWHPNTFASPALRLTIVEQILKNDIETGWEVLKNIMPGKTQIGYSTCKPKYEIINDDKITITNREYYDQIGKYLDLMIKYCKYKDERIIDIIDLLDNSSKYCFDKICNYLKSKTIHKKNDISKYKFWDKLEDIRHWFNRNKEIKENIKLEIIEKIDNVISFIKPKNNLYVVSRLFKKDDWSLIENYDNYDESKNNLHKRQFDSVEMIYKTSKVESIVELSKIVDNSYNLGMIVAEITSLSDEDNNIILDCLDKEEKMISFSMGFVYKKYNLDNCDYNEESLNRLSIDAKKNFLLVMPFTISTFKMVEKQLGKRYKEYWLKVDIRFVKDEATLKYCVEKLMIVKRYNRIIWMYKLSIHSNEKIKYDSDVILTCLEKIDNDFDKYDIREAIIDLQKNNADKERLFKIEWKFLALLSYYDNYRPITMEKIISTDPNRYCEILELAFKEHSKEKDERNINPNISINAYRFLRQWKLVPGINEDGYIDSKNIKKWYKEMKKICKEKDRLEVGLSNFGHVLFYAPKDRDGFWIDRTVAKIINEDEIIRGGYENEAFNSVGVVNCDENGTDYMKKYEEYKEKAKSTDLEGFSNFASLLRDISKDFETQANHMKETYFDL